MLLSEADRKNSPFGLRNPGVVLGALTMASAAAALIGARSIPFFLAILVAGVAAISLARGRPRALWPDFGWPERTLLVFLAYAAISGLWGLAPGRAFVMTALGALIAVASSAAAGAISAEERGAAARMAEGLWIGFALALAYFLFEILTHQSLKIAVYNLVGVAPGDVKPEWFRFENGRLAGIARVDLTRNAAPVPLLLWPVLMAVWGAAAWAWRRGVAAIIAVLAAAVVFLSPHETSKLALSLGALAFLSCRLAPDWTWRALAALWIMSSLLIVPAALALHGLGLHAAPWLQKSAQHRVVIWNYTAEKTLDAPLFGAGALTTYVMGQFIKPEVESLPGERQPRTLSQHAHNVFLQTWYELGLVGALMLAAAGAAFAGRFWRLPPRIQPFAAATFASSMAMAFASYGLWQGWFMAMFGLTAVAFAVGARAYQTREASRPPSQEVGQQLQA